MLVPVDAGAVSTGVSPGTITPRFWVHVGGGNPPSADKGGEPALLGSAEPDVRPHAIPDAKVALTRIHNNREGLRRIALE